MQNAIELKFGCSLIGLGLTRRGYDVVALAPDVLLVVSAPNPGDIARKFIAQIVIHPCATPEEAKAANTCSNPNTVADLPAYTFAFAFDTNGAISAYARRELAELMVFSQKDSMTLNILVD